MHSFVVGRGKGFGLHVQGFRVSDLRAVGLLWFRLKGFRV